MSFSPCPCISIYICVCACIVCAFRFYKTDSLFFRPFTAFFFPSFTIQVVIFVRFPSQNLSTKIFSHEHSNSFFLFNNSQSQSHTKLSMCSTWRFLVISNNKIWMEKFTFYSFNVRFLYLCHSLAPVRLLKYSWEKIMQKQDTAFFVTFYSPNEQLCVWSPKNHHNI